MFTAPLRVCVAYSPAEIPPLFADLESAVAAALCGGILQLRVRMLFEPKQEARSRAVNACLFGIYARSYAFDTIGQFR